MLKYKNIHSRVQGELKKKINAINREKLDNSGQKCGGARFKKLN